MYKKNKVDLQEYLHSMNFSTVYEFASIDARPDFRKAGAKSKYFNDTLNKVRFNIHNLYISGVLTDEDLNVLNSQLIHLPSNPSKADIEKLLKFNTDVIRIAFSAKQRKKIDINRNKINIYLNSADFDFFSRTIPATASIIMRTAKNNPELFLEWMANDMLPTYYNISEWDNISARILEDVSIYKDENEMADVLDEMSRYDDLIHAKRPWATKNN